MNRIVNALLLFLLCPMLTRAGDYEKAWEAIHKNDFKQATTLLQKVIKTGGPKKNSAISTLVLLHAAFDYEANYLDTYPGANPVATLTDPAPYVYALWFNDAVLGAYTAKEGKQLENLDRILSDSVNFNGSLRAAAAYFKAIHYRTSNRWDKCSEMYPQIGAFDNWAFVGPFDNIMGSGFDKDYGPVTQPTGKNFISSNNNPVNWFVPLYATKQGWSFVGSVFPATDAVGYMQTFVKSPVDQDVLLALGGRGAMKVWINDKLLISQEEERVTELDRWKAKAHLNSGYNRILVQIGFTGDNQRPNFLLRLTDQNFNVIKGLTAEAAAQPYKVDQSKDEPVSISHFAEDYFKKQVAAFPDDPIFAILLSKVYIRNEEYDQAKAAMYKWYKAWPKDAFIQHLYSTCLSNETDRTEYMEIVEALKTLAPDNYWILYNKLVKLEEEKNYTEAMELLDRMIAQKGEQQITTLKKLQLYAEQEKIDSMVQLIKYCYEKYPNSVEVVKMMYLYESKLNNDPAKALKVLTDFSNRRSDYEIESMLVEEYLKQGKSADAVALLKTWQSRAPGDVSSYTQLIKHYYGKQQYDSALHYLRISHQISPYNHLPYGDMASVFLQQQKTDSAYQYYKNALTMYAGGFGYREKLRMLEKKQPMDKYFPTLDYYKEINQAFKQAKDSAQSYSFVFDEKNVIVYPEGAVEQFISTAVAVNNKKGINQWKEISIPYNTAYQDVIIIKAEVIKPNGARIPAETNDNQVVFTKLEEGDVVYYNYKINSFGRGRLGREFWDRFYFSAFVPTHIASYNLLIADTIPLQYDYVNGTTRPKVSQHEQFKLYSWREEDIPAVKDEVYMPTLNDVGKVLHLSTVKSWDVIAEWYSDLTRSQSKDNFEISQVFNELFPKGTDKLDDLTKARTIYEYIVKNIAYSSVSFRQGAYVPQRAAKTLGTKLGDCKDLSTLFLAFAKKAGLEANLMLVSTNDYGRQNMRLPSMDFNHCIVKYKAGGKYYYLELTDNALPFNAIATGLAGAQVLNIPYNYKPGEKIEVLAGGNAVRKLLSRDLDMEVVGSDLKVTSNSVYTGELASEVRHDYQHKNHDELKDAVQEYIGKKFKNQVVVDDFRFTNLDNLEDTVKFSISFTVKNDVINVGDFNMIKPALIDQVATANIFKPEARRYPFQYWDYENTDDYLTRLHIKLPADRQFEQIPGNTTLSMGDMKYELNFSKESDHSLVVSRKFTTNSSKDIEAKDFKGLEDFFTGIIKAEQKYISFK